MNSGRRIKLGIAECHDERHGASRRETGDIDAPGVDVIIGNHGLRDARDDRGFPFTATLVLEIEPVPADGRIGRRRLSRIGGDETVLFGKDVHARPQREIVGILGAAVQHHEQRALAPVCGGRDINFVVPGTCRATECLAFIAGTGGDGR